MKAHPYTVTEGGALGIWLVLVLISFIVAAALVSFIPPLLSWLRVLLLPTQPDVGEIWIAFATLRPIVQGSPLLLCLYIVYKAFDQWAWRWGFVLEVPDLNGTWDGDLVSNARPADPLRVTLKIRQSWSKLMITVESNGTFSHSVNGSVNFEGPERVEVINAYVAEPKPSSDPPVINRHYGTNIFHFRVENKRVIEIVGIYYTERNQGNHGSFRFQVR